MADLTVYLANPGYVSNEVRDSIRDRVQQHLETTIGRAGALKLETGGIKSVEVRWVQECPRGIAPHDVIVSFERAPDGQGSRQGLVCQTYPDKSSEFSTRGLTSFAAAGTRSVVYVPVCTGGAKPQANILANVAFHELMHNKLNMGGALHSQKNLTLGSGGSLGEALTPGDGDVRLLAPHLGDKHNQLCE